MYALTQQRKRAAVAATAAAAVGSGAALLLADEASAATKANCAQGRLCLFSDGGFRNNYTGRAVAEDLDFRNNTYGIVTDGNERNLNDTVSAVWNNTNQYAMLFRNPGGASNRICFPPGTAVRDLHTVKLSNGIIQLPGGGASWGNRISGHKLYGGKPSDCTADGSTTVPSNQYGCSM